MTKKLTDEQAKNIFDNYLTDTGEDPGHSIEIFLIQNYRGCPIYIRVIDAGVGKVFEYLLIYEGQLYGFSRKINPNEGEELTEDERNTASSLLLATAATTIDTLLEEQCLKAKKIKKKRKKIKSKKTAKTKKTSKV